MTGSVRVDVTPGQIEAVPGSSVTLAVRIVNGTRIVDEFAIEVVGPAAAWAVVDRPRVSLLPDNEETVQVTLSPPLQGPPSAGPQTAGVKVASVTQPDVVWVEEMSVQVGPIAAASLAVKPQQVRGGRSVRLTTRVVNEGNVPLKLTLRGEDPEAVVNFRFDPPQLDVPPGEKAVAQVKATAPRAWTGPDVTRTLTFHAEGSPLTATASFVQRSRIAGWIVKAGAAIAVAALAGLAFFAANLLIGDDDGEVVAAEEVEDESDEENGPFRVPAVRDLTRSDAVTQLEGACPDGADCLNVFVVQHFHPTVAEGRVLGVIPPEGSLVEVGDEVTLTVSKGAEPPLLQPQVVPPLAGDWVNVDPVTEGITRLEIKQGTNLVVVHAWERCPQGICDRGVEVAAAGQNLFMATVEWDHGTMRRKMTLLKDGDLHVTVDTEYADGRPATSEQYTFEEAP